MQRNRQKKKEALEAGEGDEEGAVCKEAPSATVSYVDRDRAAAVGMEKDIKSNLKVNFACFVIHIWSWENSFSPLLALWGNEN